MALPPIALTSARWPDAIDVTGADAAAVGIRTTDGRPDPGPALDRLERKLGVDLRAALDDARAPSRDAAARRGGLRLATEGSE